MEKYSWKNMGKGYNASYYNDIDYKEGKKFIIIDNELEKEYKFPEVLDNYKSINKELWNEEFIGWAICHSPDLVKYSLDEWFTQSLLNYIVDNYKFIQIFECEMLKNKMNDVLWKKAYKTNNKILKYIPKEYITDEMKLIDEVNYLDIKLENLNNLFSVTTLKKLKEYKREIVRDLYDQEFLNLLKNNFDLGMDNQIAYYQVIVGIKFIECEYLNKDPQINYNVENLDDFLLTELGLESEIINPIIRSGNYSKISNFIELMFNQELDIYYILTHIRSLGKKRVEYFLNKRKILIDYYERNGISTSYNFETVESLEFELEQINEEIKKLNERALELSKKIEFKKNERIKRM